MKKLLSIIVLGLLLSGNAYAENLGTGKTVNDYVNDGYTIVSVTTVEVSGADFVYTLRSNEMKSYDAKSKPLVVTCIYNPTKNITVCFKP